MRVLKACLEIESVIKWLEIVYNYSKYDNNICQIIVRYYMPRDKIKALTYANKLKFDLSDK